MSARLHNKNLRILCISRKINRCFRASYNGENVAYAGNFAWFVSNSNNNNDDLASVKFNHTKVPSTISRIDLSFRTRESAVFL